MTKRLLLIAVLCGLCLMGGCGKEESFQGQGRWNNALYLYKKDLQTADGTDITLEQVAEIYQSDGSGAKRERELLLGTARKNRMLLITAVDIAKVLHTTAPKFSGTPAV